jgi:hypothetical protein
MTTSRIDIQQREFEQKIGYDAALRQHTGKEVVQFDWLKIGPCAALPHWKIEDMELTKIDVGDAADEWTWYYRTANAVIKVSVASFRNDELAAMKAISEFANRSNMMPLPYTRGPKNIGTISVVLEADNRYGLYWAFRNLKFEVDGNDKTAVTAVANCLQDIAVAHTRPR